MLEDLLKARSHVMQANHLLCKHFTKRRWPFFSDLCDRLLEDIAKCLNAIREGEPLPH